MGVTFQDSGSTELAKRIAEVAGDITIGVHEDAPDYPDGTPVAVVGAGQEFGVGVPRRSFLRGWVDSGGQSVIANTAQTQIGKVVDGEDADKAKSAIGEAAVTGIKARMNRGITGDGDTARTLRDTGRLQDSITTESS